MASIRIPALRSWASCSLRSHRALTQQRRWAQVHDVRFLATTQPPQFIADKYQDKLKQKAKQEGHENVDDLKAAYADKIAEQRKKDGIEEALQIPTGAIPQAPETPVSQPHGKPAAPAAARVPASGSEKQAIKSLDEIIDLEKVRELPEKELTAIWRLRHATSPQNLCAVIPTETYRAMEEMARTAPQFVLPVPHETQGAEIHFMQWTWDKASNTSTVLFTQLAEYKTRGEFASPHTTITHHLDLADEKGLILMQGQVMEDRGVQPEHAKFLLLTLQRFYGGWEAGANGQQKERAEERKKLVQYFAKGDERFSVDKLLEETERLG